MCKTQLIGKAESEVVECCVPVQCKWDETENKDLVHVDLPELTDDLDDDVCLVHQIGVFLLVCECSYEHPERLTFTILTVSEHPLGL